jgi:predicted secreted protein
MNWITAVALYFVVWWITLFAVLPLWTRPRDASIEEGGWRGAPDRPNLGRKVLANTVLAAAVWAVLWALIEYDLLGIRPPA